MLKVKDLTVKLKENDKVVLRNINLELKPGEIHLLTGKNGSGKSSLVSTIMGNPEFEVVEGNIEINNSKSTIDISNISPNERSLLGVYLANQYPVEVPGVSLTQYLRLLYNIRRPKEEQLPVFKFRKVLEEKCALINYPKHLLMRNLNEGFSGGEKKKTEILQMLVVEPQFIMLDEIDSGLDKESIADVFGGLASYKKDNPKVSFIIITHYEKVLEYLVPNKIYKMQEGQIVSK